jgi:hypothetical protein
VGDSGINNDSDVNIDNDGDINYGWTKSDDLRNLGQF